MCAYLNLISGLYDMSCYSAEYDLWFVPNTQNRINPEKRLPL